MEIIFYTLLDNQSNQKIIFHGCRLFNAPKRFDIKNPELSFELIEISNDLGEIKLKITTKKIAFFVFIDSSLYDFVSSDNFFCMEPRETRIISLRNIKAIYPGQNLLKEDISKIIEIKSLFDLIND